MPGNPGEPIILVHGGAGSPPGGQVHDAQAVRAGLEAAVLAGSRELERGGSALDAAQAAVVALEDDERFNAGRGSVLNSEGAVEMDACAMDGRGRRAGAVAAVSGVRNPIALARAVLERSDHVLLAGEGARRFAAEQGVELVDPGFHVTERQRARRQRDLEGADPSLGTVGAVVLDARGALAACTSTGGLRGKLPGRVGDSPLVGAGTYADERCAISATGDGEAFVRAVAAHQVAALTEHAGLSLGEAGERVLRELVAPLGGEGGLLIADARGNVAMPFTSGIFQRGARRGDGPVLTAVSERALEL